MQRRAFYAAFHCVSNISASLFVRNCQWSTPYSRISAIIRFQCSNKKYNCIQNACVCVYQCDDAYRLKPNLIRIEFLRVCFCVCVCKCPWYEALLFVWNGSIHFLTFSSLVFFHCLCFRKSINVDFSQTLYKYCHMHPVIYTVGYTTAT